MIAAEKSRTRSIVKLRIPLLKAVSRVAQVLRVFPPS
jgi:hypothetical protein